MIRGVLFDLFNTLVEAKNPEDKIIRAFRLRYDFYYVQRYVCRQVFQNWDVYISNILRGIGLSVNEENKRILTEILDLDTGEITPFHEAIPVLKALKAQGLKLGLISNIPNPKYDPPDELVKLFDAVAYSYRIGSIKPEKRIFDEIIRDIALPRSELVLVGDSVRGDMDGARSSGIRGILLDKTGEHMDFPERIASLNELLHRGLL